MSISTDTLHSRFWMRESIYYAILQQENGLSQQFHTGCQGTQKALHCPTSVFIVQID
jgi:hypothetical protein